jgi:4-amino-4-deoxy-L-arabinose transferase-like glycosyltransferase
VIVPRRSVCFLWYIIIVVLPEKSTAHQVDFLRTSYQIKVDKTTAEFLLAEEASWWSRSKENAIGYTYFTTTTSSCCCYRLQSHCGIPPWTLLLPQFLADMLICKCVIWQQCKRLLTSRERERLPWI